MNLDQSIFYYVEIYAITTTLMRLQLDLTFSVILALLRLSLVLICLYYRIDTTIIIVLNLSTGPNMSLRNPTTMRIDRYACAAIKVCTFQLSSFRILIFAYLLREQYIE